MNVYPCWHHGTFGYGCRLNGKKWMFVPDLGQPDKQIYRNIRLDDLLFCSSVIRCHELKQEQNNDLAGCLRRLLWLHPKRSKTVAGALLCDL